MTEVEEFEAVKQEFVLRALAHLDLVKKLSYQNFQQSGTKSILANSRLETTTCYNSLMNCIAGIKIKLQSPASKPSVQQSYNVS